MMLKKNALLVLSSLFLSQSICFGDTSLIPSDPAPVLPQENTAAAEKNAATVESLNLAASVAAQPISAQDTLLLPNANTSVQNARISYEANPDDPKTEYIGITFMRRGSATDNPTYKEGYIFVRITKEVNVGPTLVRQEVTHYDFNQKTGEISKITDTTLLKNGKVDRVIPGTKVSYKHGDPDYESAFLDIKRSVNEIKSNMLISVYGPYPPDWWTRMTQLQKDQFISDFRENHAAIINKLDSIKLKIDNETLTIRVRPINDKSTLVVMRDEKVGKETGKVVLTISKGFGTYRHEKKYILDKQTGSIQEILTITMGSQITVNERGPYRPGSSEHVAAAREMIKYISEAANPPYDVSPRQRSLIGDIEADVKKFRNGGALTAPF